MAHGVTLWMRGSHYMLKVPGEELAFDTLEERRDFLHSYRPSAEHLDELALNVVCVERIPMPLKKLDLIEGIRRLAAAGLNDRQIAYLVKIPRATMVAHLRGEYGIPTGKAQSNPLGAEVTLRRVW